MEERQIIFNGLNEKIHDIELVQMDSFTVYKDETYTIHFDLVNLSNTEISNIDVFVVGYDSNSEIVVEDTFTLDSLHADIKLDVESLVSISCSILKVNDVDYSTLDIIYLDRKMRLKDRYRDEEIEDIVFLNTTDLEITRDSILPNYVDNFGIDLEGHIVLKSEHEKIFEYFDWIKSKYMESIHEMALYERARMEVDTHTLEGYRKALEYFNGCITYKDALELRDLVQSRYQEEVYKEAIEAYNAGNLDETNDALELFMLIPDYKDAKDYIENCRQRAQVLSEQTKAQYKRYGMIFGSIALVVVGLLLFYYFQVKRPHVALKTKQVELGEEVRLSAKDYIIPSKSKNIDAYSFVIESDLMGDEYDFDPMSLEVKSKGKDYLEVGEYTIKVVSDDGKVANTTQIIVKDTTPPNIDSKPINIECNETIDYKKYYKIKDYSEYTVEVDSSKVKTDTPGNYIAIVKAVDEYGNEATKELKVYVEKEERIFYQGMYLTYADMAVYEDAGSGSVVGVIPAGSDVVITYVIEGADGNYYGVLSSGYVLIADENYDYLGWNNYIPPLRKDYDSLDDFKTACDIEDYACSNEYDDFGGLNYTRSCGNCYVFY